MSGPGLPGDILALDAGEWMQGRGRVPFPTRRFALLVALLAPAWLLVGDRVAWWVGLLLAALVLLLVFLLDALLLPDGLDARRRFPRVVGAGDEAAAEYQVASSWRGPARLTLFDRLPAALERIGEPLPPLVVPAGGEVTVPFTVVGRARGVHAPGPLAARVVGPRRLATQTVRFRGGGDERGTVAPSIAGVRRYRLLALQHRLRDAGVRNIRRRGEGTSFASLREYVVGDDPRHVDWKATARRRTPIVREYTVEQGQTVIICVDAGRLMTQLAGALSRFEHALAAAVVLADVAVHSGDHVGLLVFDDQVRAFVPPARGAAALHAVRDALVPIEATMAEPDYAAAFRTLATRHRKRSLIVLFTDVVDPRASQALIAHTTRGAVRHLPLVVALRNDTLVETAAPGATTTRALYESAAAEELLSAREEALQRMRQAGVIVLDVSPTQLSAAVVNRYLELKARAAV